MPFPPILLKLDLWPWPQWASATALTLVMAHINFYLYNPHQASASYGIPIYKHWHYYQCWFWRRRSVWPGLKRNFLLPHTFCFMPRGFIALISAIQQPFVLQNFQTRCVYWFESLDTFWSVTWRIVFQSVGRLTRSLTWQSVGWNMDCKSIGEIKKVIKVVTEEMSQCN